MKRFIAVLSVVSASAWAGSFASLDEIPVKSGELRLASPRSQVTGLGDKPPLYPHHRPSIAFGRTYPGLLVGGAQPNARSWIDTSDRLDTAMHN